MSEPVDAFPHFNEHSRVGDALDLAANTAANRVTCSDHFPGIRADLFEPQGDSAMMRIDLQDNDIDFFSHGKKFRRMRDALGPRHLRNVQQPFHPLLDLDEGAVIRQAHDFATYMRANCIALGNGTPRVWHQLFESQRHAFTFGIKFQYDYLDLCPDSEYF